MKTKSSLFYILLITSILINCSPSFTQKENWTHFRGSTLSGVAKVDKVPVIFDGNTNVKWKTEISGRGWSSPVVFGNQIWVTTASTDGKELFAVCLNFESGDIIHKIKLFTQENVIFRN